MVPGNWSQARVVPDGSSAADELADALPAALEAPRWDFDPLGRVRLETRFPADVRRRLGKSGHASVRGGPWDGTGFVQALARIDDGVWVGATDPRGEGAVFGL